VSLIISIVLLCNKFYSYVKFNVKILTWHLKLREEHRLRAFENRELRRIFGMKRNRVMEGWRKLHNEECRICTLCQV
jgi:hypothetical protein